MTTNKRPDAERHFYECHAELLRALNGIDRPVGTQKEIVELRRALLQARHECERLGIAVETLWEIAEKRRKVDEARVRAFAMEQAKVAPTVPPRLRRRIGWTVGIIVAIAIVVTWPTPHGLLGAIAGGLLSVAATQGLLTDWFPTAAVRVGRLACDLDVDVSDLWPTGSEEFMDYQFAYRLRASRSGRDKIRIKAR